MAQRLLENFQDYGLVTANLTSVWTTVSLAQLSSTGGALRTVGCYLPSPAYLEIVLDSQGTWIIGVAVRRHAGESGDLVGFYDSGTRQCALRMRADGTLACVGGSGDILTGGATPLHTGIYAYVEVKVAIGTSGNMTVRVDGQADFLGSSLNLRATGNNTADRIRFGGYTGYYDDIYINDSTDGVHDDFEGPVQVLS